MRVILIRVQYSSFIPEIEIVQVKKLSTMKHNLKIKCKVHTKSKFNVSLTFTFTILFNKHLLSRITLRKMLFQRIPVDHFQ